MRARVTVTLKAGVLNPQGKAIEGALRSLGVEGYSVEIAPSDGPRPAKRRGAA